MSFRGCRTVYPILVVRQSNKYKLNEQEYIKRVVDEININGLKLDTAVLDKPKRSNVKCTKGHNAWFPCEYCESRAVFYKKDNKRGQLTWPSCTADGEKRTIEKIIYITTRIEASDVQLPNDVCKGIVGTSHLLYQNNFNFIYDIPAEYMHSGCLGVVKRMSELTFNVGESRDRQKKENYQIVHFTMKK